MSTTDSVRKVVNLGYSADPAWTTSDVMLKLNEELGELAESLIIAKGNSTYKKLTHDEQVIEEAIDTAINCLDVVVKHLRNDPDMDEEKIASKIDEWFGIKIEKWKRVCTNSQDL